ncbi:NAD(P)/FAD-dependent oxidoreductase [Actinomycetospora corticicola]|uniref:Cyclohexanone monooxygenase n=1 Tax=Actinomycetospora corticicola TaxID=663602 RepID=A0A7Y9DRD0_9PSEU|nr:NAD(P)/FAD-dependent oxidoreductase [Actinomycetospora corticicola]NYD34038.1 cyclohexanone monooxygenase [Actinomycetospora corticicola]
MRQVDMLVVGAGFAGLRTLHTFRERGLEVAVVEANDGLGGVWYVNRYPGARCDVESYDYSLSFSPELEQEWRWSERYATQPEILRYVDHVAERFGLRRDVHLSTRMTRAEYDEDAHHWTVTTEGDTAGTWSARYLVMATGQLSVTKQPQLEGQDDFRGRILHTGAWPHEPVDLSGQRVGVIGTGSSGTQLIPVLAREVDHLTVFQRTPNFSIPANNAPLSDERDAEVKATYSERRERARRSPSGLGFAPNKQSAVEVPEDERRALYEEQWKTAGFGFLLAFYDLMLDERANDTAADFIRAKIAEKVDDPATAERLMPRGYPFGAKRPPVDSGYFEAFNRDNVDLVDMRDTPLERITEKGIRTTAEEIELDTIVFATGFDAMTGALLKPEIVGRGGRTLREHWNSGPRTYLGVGVSGFPNLFVIAGPGSPSLLSNVLLSIEAHVDWIAGLLDHAAAQGADEIEASAQAEVDWVDHVNERAAATLYPKAASYYMGAEVPGKPRVFMPYVGGVRGYRRTLDQVAGNDYEGFVFVGSREAVPAG